MTGRDAVVVDAVRTPVGRRDGGLAGVHPVDLSAHVLDALVARNGLDPALVDDVIWGCVSQTGEQAVNVARNAALAAGWPEDVIGVTVDRQCGSSQQAVHFAAAGVIAGQYDVAVAGGVESMSRVPMLCTVTQGRASRSGPRMTQRYEGGLVPRASAPRSSPAMGALAHRPGRDRRPLPRLRGRGDGRGGFDGRDRPGRRGRAADEGIRRGTDLDTLAGLRTVFRTDGVVTAGQLLADLGRRGRTARHHLGAAPPGTAGDRWPGCTRSRRPGWTRSPCSPRPSRPPGVLDRAGLRRRHRRVRGQRGVRLGHRRLAGGDRRRPRWSTRWAARSRSATRWAGPGPG